MPFLTQGKTNWKYILIVLVLAVLVGGGISWWIWNNVFVEKPLSICGPSGKYYWINISNCDKSCLTAEDCKFTCGCGAINKRETCHTQGITYDCVDKEVKCENNICVVGEEKVKDKTTDWKTYKNEEYGFEIEHPSDWYVFKTRAAIATFSESTEDIPEDSGIIYFNYRKDVSIERILEIKRDWLDLVTKEKVEGLQVESSSIKTVVIDNVAGYRVYVSGKDLRWGEEIKEVGINYYFPHPQKEGFFQIEGKFKGEQREKYANIFNQMLSTFRFLE